MDRQTSYSQALAISAAKLLGMNTSSDALWGTFAQTIQSRRANLGMTQRDVYQAGGPSPVTLQRLENPSPGRRPPEPKTMARIDRALLWPAGAAHQLLTGTLSAAELLNMPTDGSSLHKQERDPLAKDLDTSRAVGMLAGRLIRYLEVTRSIPGLDPHLVQEADSLEQSLTEHYIIQLLEEYGGPGRTLPESLRSALLDALIAPEPDPGTAEHTRWSYMRWLTSPSTHSIDDSRFKTYWSKHVEHRSEGRQE